MEDMFARWIYGRMEERRMRERDVFADKQKDEKRDRQID
jgi:hypothetical protein